MLTNSMPYWWIATNIRNYRYGRLYTDCKYVVEQRVSCSYEFEISAIIDLYNQTGDDLFRRILRYSYETNDDYRKIVDTMCTINKSHYLADVSDASSVENEYVEYMRKNVQSADKLIADL